MFQTTFDENTAGRAKLYPNAIDQNFLGYDRDLDRWRVDAAGIKIYASGISVELDKNYDSVAVWSASGTPVIPIYAPEPIDVSESPKPLINSYDKILAVPRLVETTIVDYIVPIGEVFSFTAGKATGDTEATYYLQVDGNNIESVRTSWCDRTANFETSQGAFQADGGSVVRIRVYHEEDTATHGTQNFWGNVAGILM